jgi:hypothetical protein
MFCLPVVAEADFEMLEHHMRPHLPQSYEGWLALSAELAREHYREGVALIRVKPREFIEYTDNAGCELDIQTLLDFVAFNPWHDPEILPS